MITLELVHVDVQDVAADALLVPEEKILASLSDAEISAAIVSDQTAQAKAVEVLGEDMDRRSQLINQRLVDGYRGDLHAFNARLYAWIEATCSGRVAGSAE